MSMTIPSASSSARRNVASTTKVAPCRRWAGPNTSPRKLCAIIMWSRTVTLNNGSPSRVGRRVVGDPVAQGGQLPAGQPGKHGGQLREAALPGDQGIERGVGEQVQ